MVLDTAKMHPRTRRTVRQTKAQVIAALASLALCVIVWTLAS